MDSLSVDKIRALDHTAKELGLSETVLIENASANLFNIIDSLKLGKKVLVVSGRGNNGADALSCARKLFSRGYNVTVVSLEEKPLGEEALRQKLILEKIGLPVYCLQADDPNRRGAIHELSLLLEDCDFVLDGILGVGIKGQVSPFLKEAITLINQSKKRVVACDIPSGLFPDTGLFLGAAIKAKYTITFIAAKKGFFLNQGPESCGKIFVVDIGISREILEKLDE